MSWRSKRFSGASIGRSNPNRRDGSEVIEVDPLGLPVARFHLLESYEKSTRRNVETPVSRRIRLALDATYAAYPQRTGIGIYSEKLINALSRSIPAESRSRHDFILSFRPGPFLRWAWNRSWPEPFVKSPLLDYWLRIPRATMFHGLNQRLPEKTYPVEVVTSHPREDLA